MRSTPVAKTTSGLCTAWVEIAWKCCVRRGSQFRIKQKLLMTASRKEGRKERKCVEVGEGDGLYTSVDPLGQL